VSEVTVSADVPTGVTPPSDADLLGGSLRELMAEARRIRDVRYGRRVTFSPKVFIPLTMLCRDRCGYCTFAKPPSRVAAPYLSLEDVLDLARRAALAGCHEALFTLGERPEDRYPAAAAWLDEAGHGSTIEYLAEAARAVRDETGSSPTPMPAPSAKPSSGCSALSPPARG